MSETKKGIKEFFADLKKDEKLAKKFKSVKDTKEIVKLAKAEGYDFTENEIMDLQMEMVSGGKGGAKKFFNGVGEWLEDIGDFLC